MSDFTFNISLSVLNHLGRNLYRNFITVLGEAISNSWDADASNVYIIIDREENTLTIKDDGNGMTESEFQSKFLKIGYSKRKEGVVETENGRPYIGRKGIGKLALLSCAERIHVASKTSTTELIGGIIDNGGLDEAIHDDLIPEQYKLGVLNTEVFGDLLTGFEKGTVIYFENIDQGIRNRVEYIRKLIALYFRFSLVDKSFKIHLNGEPITIDELDDLSSATQFVWQINTLEDPYLETKISEGQEQIKQFKNVRVDLPIKGFIASVKVPSDLKIKMTDEKVTVDLYVNGRLREKDLLKHIPTARVVESYLYGQVHYDSLDNEVDRFTSSREGVISDDPLFQGLLENLKIVLKDVLNDWDVFRLKVNEDGDSENPRITKKERKSKELFSTVINDFVPPTSSANRHLVDQWVDCLGDEAQFNLGSYAECFVAENLLRNFVKHKALTLSPEAIANLVKYKKKENDAKNIANISFDIRANSDDLLYFSMDDLSNFVDKPTQPLQQAGIARDAKVYKPVRDAMAHTSILTTVAKNSLNTTFENIKARLKKLLDTDS